MPRGEVEHALLLGTISEALVAEASAFSCEALLMTCAPPKTPLIWVELVAIPSWGGVLFCGEEAEEEPYERRGPQSSTTGGREPRLEPKENPDKELLKEEEEEEEELPVEEGAAGGRLEARSTLM